MPKFDLVPLAEARKPAKRSTVSELRTRLQGVADGLVETAADIESLLTVLDSLGALDNALSRANYWQGQAVELRREVEQLQQRLVRSAMAVYGQ